MKEVPLTQGKVAIIDDDDFKLVSQYKWYARRIRNAWYAVRNVTKEDGSKTTQFMHTFITGYARTDHKNGNGLDNQRINLREATTSQNGANRRKNPNGTSRYKGVHWNTGKKKWFVQIMVEQNNIFLGLFDDEELAAKAYDAKATKVFGEFAKLNFPS